MKTTANTFRMFLILFCIGLVNLVAAQNDTIVKTNGEKIVCKILEVGANGVSYKRADMNDSPLFIAGKEEITYIKLRNGEKQVFPAMPNKQSNQNSNNSLVNSNDNGKKKKDLGPISDQHKIIYDGKKYFVDGRRIGSRDADRLMSRSSNPAVQIPLKTAKLTKTFQKIMKITSYPSTISGGVASISTFRTVFIEAQNGGAQMSSWVNAGLSFIGTLAFPITSKILKKRQTKLYDKTIDLYNLDKK